MLRLNRVILMCCALACLNLIQLMCTGSAEAQAPVMPPIPPINITPTPAPVVPAPAVTPVSADPTLKVKYYEFKSICLKPEQLKTSRSESVNTKRLALLNKKLKASEAKKNSTLTTKIKSLIVKEHLQQENFRLAEEYFKKESANFPEDEALLLSSDLDIGKGLLRQARDNLNLYLEKNPKNIPALEKVAQVYILLESYTEARMAYEDLAKINSKKDYTEQLCETSSRGADHLNVDIYCARLIRKYPTNHLGYIYQGISWRDQEKYAEALKQFQLSLKIKPSEFASTCLAESYFLIDQHDKAISQYKESIKIQPLSMRAHLGLANTLVKKNLFSEALEYYKKSCELGLKPLTEMFTVTNILKDQKSNLSDSYFSEIQSCKDRP